MAAVPVEQEVALVVVLMDWFLVEVVAMVAVLVEVLEVVMLEAMVVAMVVVLTLWLVVMEPFLLEMRRSPCRISMTAWLTTWKR